MTFAFFLTIRQHVKFQGHAIHDAIVVPTSRIRAASLARIRREASLYTARRNIKTEMPLSLYISFCVPDIYLMMADPDSHNMLS